MKKILKYCLIGLGLFLIGQKQSLASNLFELEKDPSGLTYKIEKSERTVRLWFMLVKDRQTGELIYCLEPGVALSEEEYHEWDEWDYAKMNLTEEQKDFITKVAYFGYGYKNHNHLYYYYAAQLLIWEKIIPNDWHIYYTERLGGEKVNWFLEERKEILALIEQDNIMPSIQNQTFEWNNQDLLTIKDTNEVLKDYKLTTKTNLSVTKNESQLEIKSNSKEQQTLSFEKEYLGSPLKFYSREDGQNIMRRGKLKSKTFQITLKPYQLELEIEKRNEEQEPLSNVSFALIANEEIKDSRGNIKYQKGDIIKNLTTDEKGIARLSKLWEGNYCLKETKTPINYQSLEKPICFELNKENNKKVLKIINKKKTQNLKIQKQDAKTYEPMHGVHFQIWESGECVFDGFTNEDGEIILENLPIGTYKIIEIDTLDDYILEKEPVYVELDCKEKEKIITLTNIKIEKVPNTYTNECSEMTIYIEERKRRK